MAISFTSLLFCLKGRGASDRQIHPGDCCPRHPRSIAGKVGSRVRQRDSRPPGQNSESQAIPAQPIICREATAQGTGWAKARRPDPVAVQVDVSA